MSPELAERARAALPDRPWEAFLPPPTAAATVSAPVGDAPARRPIWIPHPPRPDLDAPRPRRAIWIPHPPPAPPAPPRRIYIPHPAPGPARASAIGSWQRAVALTVGAVALLLGGYELAARVPPTDDNQRVLAAESIAPRPALSTGSAERRGLAGPVRPYARPNAGYLMPSDGRLLVDSLGRAITQFSYQAVCVGRVVFHRIAIRPNGRFRTKLSVGRLGKVVVQGSFVGRLVKGTVRVSGSGCKNRAAGFTGRLS